ncbi:transcription regulator [Salinarchaeum sp. Harcht-Bsk1]|uniref:helix-turn-helix domain-containing protein n=1 Tax=Salinarchaeum sp. Harcht-Bsk1 TaxID=1333523 RepID=UPI0003424590|nr:helix-turn-helix domain-containing protein [Salinarchaeum sp. Harcht-Bsk1]AGN00530.1 transcription regulator [Salinarchaeum sp. Harcht-Bsk1]
MRSIRLAVAMPPDDRHPMHQYAMDHGGYTAYWQLHWQGRPDDGMTLLFYIEGPQEPYLEALEERVPDATHSVTDAEGNGFYLYVHADLDGLDRGLADAIDRPGVLLVPPLEYRMDGTLVASLVGPAEALSVTVDEIPDALDPEVLQVRPYGERSFRTAGALTDRQREIVDAALEEGYYEEPREASVEDVATATGCAPSTAAEHLRKAEAVVMERAATGPVTEPAVGRPAASE